MRTKLHLLALLAFGLVLTAGCPRGEDPPEPTEAQVVLGTGEWMFEQLEDGQEVELVLGSQGGWHVWASVRAQGLEPDNVLFRIESEVVGMDVDPSISEIYIDLEDMPEGAADTTTMTHQFLGWPHMQASPECVHGNDIRIRVILTDEAGNTVMDERTITPVAEPGFEPMSDCEPGA